MRKLLVEFRGFFDDVAVDDWRVGYRCELGFSYIKKIAKPSIVLFLSCRTGLLTAFCRDSCVVMRKFGWRNGDSGFVCPSDREKMSTAELTISSREEMSYRFPPGRSSVAKRMFMAG